MMIRLPSILPSLVLFALVMGGATPALAVPPNDLCANAQLITVPALNTLVTVTGTNVAATSDYPNTCSVNDDLDVWYLLTASIAADYTFDTFDSLLGDTTLAAYTACAGTRLACNDDANADTFWSRIIVRLTVGQSIRVRVSGYDDSSGAFNLNVIATLPPANDLCGAPEPIALNQIKTGSNAGAITDFTLNTASCGTANGAGGVNDVFYSFTPPASGSYKASLCASGFDTVLAILSNCSGTLASIVACNDDSTSCTQTTRSEISAVTLSAGVTYIVRVAGYDDMLGGASGPYSLVITSNTPPPAGVCCRGATCNASVASGAACTGSLIAGQLAGASFPNAASCNAGGSTTTPCCYADYNKVNSITVQDIFDYLNDWFAGSPFAATGGNGTPGTLTVQAIFDFLNAWFGGGC